MAVRQQVSDRRGGGTTVREPALANQEQPPTELLFRITMMLAPAIADLSIYLLSINIISFLMSVSVSALAFSAALVFWLLTHGSLRRPRPADDTESETWQAKPEEYEQPARPPRPVEPEWGVPPRRDGEYLELIHYAEQLEARVERLPDADPARYLLRTRLAVARAALAADDLRTVRQHLDILAGSLARGVGLREDEMRDQNCRRLELIHKKYIGDGLSDGEAVELAALQVATATYLDQTFPLPPA